MGVAPEPGELLRLSAEVNLPVEEVSDSDIVELDRRPVSLLFHGDEIDDVEWVGGIGDSEAADLGLAIEAEPCQFRPGRRAEL
jgi:hypothetical protein